MRNSDDIVDSATDLIFGLAQYVGWLEIAMRNARVVQEGERSGNIFDNASCLNLVEVFALFNTMKESS